MTKKPQQRTLITRQRILDATRALSHELGIEQVTADAIAKRADVAKGTVFAHFTDMDGLLSHVLLDELRNILAPAPAPARADETSELTPVARFSEGQIRTGDNPLTAINGMMMQFVRVVGQNQTMMRLFLKNTGATDGSYAPEFIDILSQLDQVLARFLEHWRDDATLRPRLRQDRNAQELLDGLIAFMTHVSVQCQCGQIRDLAQAHDVLLRHSEAWLLVPEDMG